jgi:hypothetical protein
MQETGESQVGQQNQHGLVIWASDQFSEERRKREKKEAKEGAKAAKLVRLYTDAGSYHRVPSGIVEGDLNDALKGGPDFDHPAYFKAFQDQVTAARALRQPSGLRASH